MHPDYYAEAAEQDAHWAKVDAAASTIRAGRVGIDPGKLASSLKDLVTAAGYPEHSEFYHPMLEAVMWAVKNGPDAIARKMNPAP